MRERAGIISNIDGIIFFVWLILALAGCVAIYSASHVGGDSLPTMDGFFSLSGMHGKQFIFLCISLFAMFVVWALDYRLIINFTPFAYVAALLLLLLTLVIGAEINGSKSWIKFGSVQIQPAEFAKLTTGLMLAYYLSREERVFSNLKKTAITLGILALPMAFILLQGDFGSMMIYSVLIFVLFREGLTPLPIYLGLALIAIALLTIYFGFPIMAAVLAGIGLLIFLFSKQKKFVWRPIVVLAGLGILFSLSVGTLFSKVLKNYQQDRILVLLGMKQDLRGAGYNLWQSKMAIGSGGLTGKGYLQGTQTHGDFVPEVNTDYIFSSIGEEWGFLGSLFVVGMFSLLIFRILVLAEKQRSSFSRIFMYCAASFFFMHAFINIAMVIGIFPTVGIPLPFFSKGGSSLLSFSLIIAVVLRLNAESSYILGD